MKNIFKRFWGWYNHHYTLTVGVSFAIFVWQLVHLYWMGAHVVAVKFFDIDYFPLSPLWTRLVAIADYLEIPAILSVSLVYINALWLGQGSRLKNSWLLILLNSQWLHLYWITDEYIIAAATLHGWLAALAISIDYLELPVMYDTGKKFVIAFKRKTARSGEARPKGG